MSPLLAETAGLHSESSYIWRLTRYNVRRCCGGAEGRVCPTISKVVSNPTPSSKSFYLGTHLVVRALSWTSRICSHVISFAELPVFFHRVGSDGTT